MQDDDRAYQIDMQPAPFEHVPQRVVSLVPSLTESLFDLDLGSRLVGISDYCTRPANRVNSLVRVSGPRHPDLERIIALQPDLVLMDDERNRREDADALREVGLVVWITAAHSVLDTLNLLWTIMDAFDHAVMVPRVREIERAYDYTQAAAEVAPPVRVFAPLWRDPWLTFTQATYAHDILRVCGGENVFAEADAVPDDDHSRPAAVPDGPRYPAITLDAVVTAQPDIVLLPDEPYVFDIADAEVIRAALPHSRIHHIDGSLLTWHGTRTAYALRDLPALLMESDQEPT